MAVAVFSSVALVYLTALVYMPAKREINSGLSDMGRHSKLYFSSLNYSNIKTTILSFLKSTLLNFPTPKVDLTNNLPDLNKCWEFRPPAACNVHDGGAGGDGRLRLVLVRRVVPLQKQGTIPHFRRINYHDFT